MIMTKFEFNLNHSHILVLFCTAPHYRNQHHLEPSTIPMVSFPPCKIIPCNKHTRKLLKTELLIMLFVI